MTEESVEAGVSASDIHVESLLNASVSDLATDRDQLGFRPYVNAIVEFLTNSLTRPPLTVSIEGEWGCGKSSFMKQIRKTLVDRQKASGDAEFVTVWFNPWRYDKNEAVWAAFAIEFVRQL